MLFLVMSHLRKSVFALASLVLAAASLSNAQAVSPSIGQPGQPAQPSSNPALPTAEFGFMGSGAATEITPEGYLRTGFEELVFFSGPDLEPANAHISTLEQGHLPIVHYKFGSDGITYRFTIFASKIDKSAIVRARQHAKFPFMPGFDITADIYEPQVNFVRVDITNSAREPKRAVFASGVRYDGPTTSGATQGAKRQPGESFSPGWMNYFDDANFYRFNRDLYSFPAGYTDRSFKIRKNWSEPNPQYVLVETQLNAGPTTPIGIVTYARDLKPGESWALDFKMPLIPNADPFVISAIDDASFDAIEAQLHGAAKP
ncbi:MAG: hypothetical protein ACLPLZ_03280 [Terracidiphilus sp.]